MCLWLEQAEARSGDRGGLSRSGAGLAGLFSWVVAASADRDLFFQDLDVLSDSEIEVAGEARDDSKHDAEAIVVGQGDDRSVL